MFDAAATLVNNLLSPSIQGPTDRQRNPGRSGSGIGHIPPGPSGPFPHRRAQGGFTSQSAISGLAGVLLNGQKTRKLAPSAARTGGTALVASLAHTAWQRWNTTPHSADNSPDVTAVPSQPASAPPMLGTNFMPVTPSAQEDLARLFLKAMISAAKADGGIRHSQQIRVNKELFRLGVPGVHRRFIEVELARPTCVDELVQAAHSPELAAELYMASILVITGETIAEKDYLRVLSSRLRLAPDLVGLLHACADEASIDPATPENTPN